MRKLKLFFIGITILTTSGCVMYQPVAYDPGKNKHVKKIAIATMPNPKQMGGEDGTQMLGAPAFVYMQKKKQDYSLEDEIQFKKDRFHFQTEITKQLEKKLRHLGYQIEKVSFSRKSIEEWIQNHDELQTNADAILECVLSPIQYGYYRGSPLGKILPHMNISFKLIDRKTKELLYYEKFEYGWQNPFLTGSTFIPAPKKYALKELPDTTVDEFGDAKPEPMKTKELDVVKYNADLAIEGMKDAINRVTSAVANKLTRTQ